MYGGVLFSGSDLAFFALVYVSFFVVVFILDFEECCLPRRLMIPEKICSFAGFM